MAAPAGRAPTRTVAILNQKGGVGKTTVTLGLASAAAAARHRALVVDLDPQAASTWALGIDPATVGASTGDLLDARPLADVVVPSAWSEFVDVVPASGALQAFEHGPPKRLAKALRRADLDRYDAVLIDCPPSLGNLTTNALTAAQYALVVVEPSALGLRGVGGLADVIDEVWDRYNPLLELAGVVLNRVPAVSSEAERRIAELGRIVGLETIWSPAIPQRVILNQAVGERRPIHSYGSRAGVPAAAFDSLWSTLLATLGRAGSR